MGTFGGRGMIGGGGRGGRVGGGRGTFECLYIAAPRHALSLRLREQLREYGIRHVPMDAGSAVLGDTHKEGSAVSDIWTDKYLGFKCGTN